MSELKNTVPKTKAKVAKGKPKLSPKTDFVPLGTSTEEKSSVQATDETQTSKPVILPTPAQGDEGNTPEVKDEKSRELTTAQKISHFKKKLEGLSKLATELGVVDNRFRQIRKTLNEVTKLVDPGALVQAAAVKSKRREDLNTTPLVKSVVKRPVLQASAPQVKPSPRPNQARAGAQPTSGGFNTAKPGPKIPFGGGKKKV